MLPPFVSHRQTSEAPPAEQEGQDTEGAVIATGLKPTILYLGSYMAEEFEERRAD